MIQSRGSLPELIAAIYITSNVSSRKRRILKRYFLLAPEVAPALARKATEYYINKGVNELNKKFSSSKSLGITLTNNEIKDIMKVLKSLENTGILLKGTTRKTISQE